MTRMLMNWLGGLVVLTATAGAIASTSASLHQADNDWIDAITNAVLIERRGGGGYPGVRWEPYLGQLQVVRTHFERRDVEATYKAMNRFMDMLEARENGVPAATADWLFDFCYVVVPAQYHDVSRHIEKFKRDQFGTSDGLFRQFVLTAFRKEVCHENDGKHSVDSNVLVNGVNAWCAGRRGNGRE
ncbi:exported protein of unknown function [Nitrospira tepida]|uniref:Uncharacterized protein n=1 Tax=Nitrospira tepida TaxID=2973512 RepID=A0AA86K9Y3_9BACT|nr:hypothetical protein [Nitrospira tepida]CAI4029661.1 exported protein of unknown function [Nitrospira tepida]